MSVNTSSPSEDGPSESELLGTYKTYFIEMPFRVIAHSEEQAKQRWNKFVEFLDHLAGTWEHAHELVEFVQPWPSEIAVTFAEEKTVYASELRSVGPANDVDYLLRWIDPEAGDDFDPQASAYRAMFGEDEESNE